MKSSHYSWGPAFMSAVSDLQSPQLAVKIAAARELIDARVQELLTLEHHAKERMALIDALFALHCVEQYRREQFSKETSVRAAGCAL